MGIWTKNKHLTAISLKTRLFAGFILLMLLFSGLQIYSLMNLERANDEFQLINRFHLKVSLHAFSLETSQSSLLLLLKNLTAPNQGNMTKRPGLLKRWIKITQDKRNDAYLRLKKLITNKWKLLRSRDREFMTLKVLPLMRGVEDSIGEIQKKFDDLLKSPDAISKADARMISRREHLIMNRVRRISSIIRNRVRRFAQRLEDNERFILKQQMLLLAGAILLGIIVIIMAARPLRYLRGLTEGARSLGSGNLSLRIPVTSQDELGVLAEEFNTMAEAIEEREARLIQSERLAAAGRLAAQIAHEIRNPLAAISFNAELLHESLGEIEAESPALVESRELITGLQREVDRLTGITEEYLAFSRLPKPRIKATDCNSFLRDVLDFIEGELILERYRLETSLAEGLPPVSMDEDLMRQVMLNLVRNAKEAMPDGGTIRIASTTEKGRVFIRVCDEGPGFDEEIAGRVFEAFFTTKKHGTGLGMALSHQIVRDHNGTITLGNGQGTAGHPGAVVTVSLPVVQEEDRA